jgi:hypothetical protein
VPTILRFRSFRIVIYTDDHPPPHVHAVGPDGKAIFLLNCPTGPVLLREETYLTQAQVKALANFLSEHLELLCKAWEDIHGDSARA